MGRFAEATAVTPLSTGQYRAELDGGFAIAGALNGGYLMAVMQRAAVEASPHPHPVVTSASFLRVARAGTAEVRVEPLKTGRTVATARVTLLQNDDPLVDATITTGILNAEAEPLWTAAPATVMPPLEECSNFRSGRPTTPPQDSMASQTAANFIEPADSEALAALAARKKDRSFADKVDLSYDPATMGWLDGRPSGRPELRAWFRLPDGGPEDIQDPYTLTLAVDALPPIAANIAAYGWAPTVELTLHVRALPAPGRLAVLASGKLVSDGWFDEEVEVWDSTGHLVAQSRQLARLPRQSP